MTTQKFKWQGIVSKYAYPETWRSLWQVFNSVIPFFVGWYFMYRSLEVGYWLTLLLAVPTVDASGSGSRPSTTSGVASRSSPA